MARPPKPAGRPSAVRRKKKKQSNPIEELQKLARAPAQIEHLERMYREMFRTRNDRGAAILLGTFVEDALQRAIEQVLHIRPKQHRALFGINAPLWPAPGSEDTELGVLMEPEVGHGETEVHAGVQA